MENNIKESRLKAIVMKEENWLCWNQNNSYPPEDIILVKPLSYVDVEHFSPEGDSLGFLNELQHLYLRVQIAKHKLQGFSLVWEGKVIVIDSTGELDYDPDQFKEIIGNWDADFQLVVELRRAQNS